MTFDITFDDFRAQVPAAPMPLGTISSPRLRDAERIDRVGAYLNAMFEAGDDADRAVSVVLSRQLTAISETMPLARAALVAESIVSDGRNLDLADEGRTKPDTQLFTIGSGASMRIVRFSDVDPETFLTAVDEAAYLADARTHYARWAATDAGIVPDATPVED